MGRKIRKDDPNFVRLPRDNFADLTLVVNRRHQRIGSQLCGHQEVARILKDLEHPTEILKVGFSIN